MLAPRDEIICFDQANSGTLTLDTCRSRDRLDLYTRIVERLGHNPDHVCEIRVTESAIDVVLIDFDHPDWPAVTARHLNLLEPPLTLDTI